MAYTLRKEGAQITQMRLSDSEGMEEHAWLEFGPGVSWTPQRIEINGRKGRRAACVLAEDGFHYRVYDLDKRDQGIDGGDAMSEAS